MENENKPVYTPEKKTFFSPNKFMAILIYVLVLFLFAGVITIAIGTILGRSQGIDVELLMDSFTATSYADLLVYPEEIVRVNSMAQGWGNFLGYLIALLGVAFYMRDDLVMDFRHIKEEKKKQIPFIIVSAILFLGITLLIDFGIGRLVPSSDNQSTIEAIILYGGAVPMIIATVFFAPIVEELIYRKAIFSIFRKYGLAACYLISILFFSLPHMMTSSMDNMGVWILQCIPYAVSGGLLCLIYHKSNHNIYASIAAHMANNLLAGILILIQM